jgi:hypothetical protein
MSQTSPSCGRQPQVRCAYVERFARPQTGEAEQREERFKLGVVIAVRAHRVNQGSPLSRVDDRAAVHRFDRTRAAPFDRVQWIRRQVFDFNRVFKRLMEREALVVSCEYDGKVTPPKILSTERATAIYRHEGV